MRAGRVRLRQKTMNVADPILTAAEIAAELRISKSQVCKLFRGEVEDALPLPHLKVGRRYVISRSLFEKWKQTNVSGIVPAISEKNAVAHLTKEI
jgi:hypothetical protein